MSTDKNGMLFLIVMLTIPIVIFMAIGIHTGKAEIGRLLFLIPGLSRKTEGTIKKAEIIEINAVVGSSSSRRAKLYPYAARFEVEYSVKGKAYKTTSINLCIPRLTLKEALDDVQAIAPGYPITIKHYDNSAFRSKDINALTNLRIKTPYNHKTVILRYLTHNPGKNNLVFSSWNLIGESILYTSLSIFILVVIWLITGKTFSTTIRVALISMIIAGSLSYLVTFIKKHKGKRTPIFQLTIDNKYNGIVPVNMLPQKDNDEY